MLTIISVIIAYREHITKWFIKIWNLSVKQFAKGINVLQLMFDYKKKLWLENQVIIEGMVPASISLTFISIYHLTIVNAMFCPLFMVSWLTMSVGKDRLFWVLVPSFIWLIHIPETIVFNLISWSSLLVRNFVVSCDCMLLSKFWPHTVIRGENSLDKKRQRSSWNTWV